MKKYSQLLKIQFPLCDLDILQALLDLFNGLAYMHSKFIMHRDIKEANLLYEPFVKSTQNENNRQIGKLIICDFSLARFSIKTNDIKNFNYLTPETVTSSHRAPEVFQSIKTYESKGMKNCKLEYNEKVDVWSAGIVMFYLLTGLQLYYAIFCFQKSSPILLEFISNNQKIKSLEKKAKWDSRDRELIYTELLLSLDAIPFIISLLDKYIDRKLKYIDFYREIFISCVSSVEQRPAAVDLAKKINKHILNNDLTEYINDCGFIEQVNSKFIETTELMKFNHNYDIDKYVSVFMNDALQRIKANDVRGLILSKISLLMNRFCISTKKQITEINQLYIIAAAHLVEIMFLYEDIFTTHFRSSRDRVYRFMNELLFESQFLEGLF
jgi:serine/threonine protein kinase